MWGQAILHSGTVGAALTAGVNGVRELAVSLDVGQDPAGVPHWNTAGHLVVDVLELLMATPVGTVLTVNVPNRPVAALSALRHATLAKLGTVQTRVDRL
jgi:5'-nucleotidase